MSTVLSAEALSAAPLSSANLWSGHADSRELDHWSAVAQTVADELAKGALERDHSGADPLEALELLREHGLAGLVVPAVYGGAGAHWETAFRVIRILARADASVAQILGYHYLNSSCLAFYGAGRDQSAWFRKIAEQDQLWSDALNPVDPDLELVADGTGLPADRNQALCHRGLRHRRHHLRGPGQRWPARRPRRDLRRGARTRRHLVPGRLGPPGAARLGQRLGALRRGARGGSGRRGLRRGHRVLHGGDPGTSSCSSATSTWPPPRARWNRPGN